MRQLQWRKQGGLGAHAPQFFEQNKHTFKLHEICQFSQFIFKKIITTLAIRSHFLKTKIHQIRFRLRLRHIPRWGAHSAPLDPLAGFLRGPTSKGRERKEERRTGKWGEGKRKGLKKRRSKREKGRGGKIDETPNWNFWLRHWTALSKSKSPFLHFWERSKVVEVRRRKLRKGHVSCLYNGLSSLENSAAAVCVCVCSASATSTPLESVSFVDVCKTAHAFSDEGSRYDTMKPFQHRRPSLKHTTMICTCVPDDICTSSPFSVCPPLHVIIVNMQRRWTLMWHMFALLSVVILYEIAVHIVKGQSYKPEMDTDRVHPRIGSGRVGPGHGSDSRRFWRVGSRVRPTFYRIFLCFIFHRFYPYCCRPEHHRPVCSSRSDTGNQLWLQVILWVVLRRDSGQQETVRRQLVVPSHRRFSLHEISRSRSLER